MECHFLDNFLFFLQVWYYSEINFLCMIIDTISMSIPFVILWLTSLNSQIYLRTTLTSSLIKEVEIPLEFLSVQLAALYPLNMRCNLLRRIRDCECWAAVGYNARKSIGSSRTISNPCPPWGSMKSYNTQICLTTHVCWVLQDFLYCDGWAWINRKLRKRQETLFHFILEGQMDIFGQNMVVSTVNNRLKPIFLREGHLSKFEDREYERNHYLNWMVWFVKFRLKSVTMLVSRGSSESWRRALLVHKVDLYEICKTPERYISIALLLESNAFH